MSEISYVAVKILLHLITKDIAASTINFFQDVRDAVAEFVAMFTINLRK
ncbi:hypothetical protein [Anabaena sp. CCY 9910]